MTLTLSRRATRQSLRWLCFACLFVIVSGCARTPTVVRADNPSAETPHPARNVLTVCPSDNLAQRTLLESLLVSRLRATGVAADASHLQMAGSEPVSESALRALASEQNYDAILVARIVSVDSEVERREGRTEIVARCRQSDPVSLFLYDYDEFKNPDEWRVAQTVALVSALYRAEDGRRLWAIQSTCYDKQSLRDAFTEQAETIVSWLQEDGWLPPR